MLIVRSVLLIWLILFVVFLLIDSLVVLFL